jgi:outer membrane protein assembly factor BamD
MVVKFATLVLAGSIVASGQLPGDEMVRVAEGIGKQSQCDNDLAVGRYYIGKRDYTPAIHRLKILVQKCPTSSNTPEILARLAEAYLVFGIASEAQTAVAVLERKYPGARFTVEARDALGLAGLIPVEDEKSWIALAFQ